MCTCRGGFEGTGCEGGPECLDDEGGPLPSEQGRRPFAVCAPGMRPLAELVLLLHGEQVSEVRESRFIEGADVYGHAGGCTAHHGGSSSRTENAGRRVAPSR